MNVLEIPVIGSRKSAKEQIFTLLSQQNLRKFEGLDVGCLDLSNNFTIYFYFLHQEDENYYYLWDLIIPYSLACLVVCDVSNIDIFEKNLEIIKNLEKKFTAPLYISYLSVSGEQPGFFKEKAQEFKEKREFIEFNPQDKKSAKDLLLRVLNSRKD